MRAPRALGWACLALLAACTHDAPPQPVLGSGTDRVLTGVVIGGDADRVGIGNVQDVPFQDARGHGAGGPAVALFPAPHDRLDFSLLVGEGAIFRLAGRLWHVLKIEPGGAHAHVSVEWLDDARPIHDYEPRIGVPNRVRVEVKQGHAAMLGTTRVTIVRVQQTGRFTSPRVTLQAGGAGPGSRELTLTRDEVLHGNGGDWRFVDAPGDSELVTFEQVPGTAR